MSSWIHSIDVFSTNCNPAVCGYLLSIWLVDSANFLLPGGNRICIWDLLHDCRPIAVSFPKVGQSLPAALKGTQCGSQNMMLQVLNLWLEEDTMQLTSEANLYEVVKVWDLPSLPFLLQLMSHLLLALPITHQNSWTDTVQMFGHSLGDLHLRWSCLLLELTGTSFTQMHTRFTTIRSFQAKLCTQESWMPRCGIIRIHPIHYLFQMKYTRPAKLTITLSAWATVLWMARVSDYDICKSSSKLLLAGATKDVI